MLHGPDGGPTGSPPPSVFISSSIFQPPINDVTFLSARKCDQTGKFRTTMGKLRVSGSDFHTPSSQREVILRYLSIRANWLLNKRTERSSTRVIGAVLESCKRMRNFLACCCLRSSRPRINRKQKKKYSDKTIMRCRARYLEISEYLDLDTTFRPLSPTLINHLR